MRLEIPEDRLVLLLTHTDCSIAAAAVVGEWDSTPRGIVRVSVNDHWRKAVINCFEREFEDEEIFRKDPSLAFDWLQLRTKESRMFSYHGETLLKVALQVINLEQRRALLQEIGDGHWYDEVIHGIVDEQLEIYRDLLQNEGLMKFHLSPLRGNPDDFWIEKALVALDAGYSPLKIAKAVYGSFRFFSGNESGYWAQWVESFKPLLEHDDPRIPAIGKIGTEYATSKRDIASSNERHEDIYGIERD